MNCEVNQSFIDTEISYSSKKIYLKKVSVGSYRCKYIAKTLLY